MSKHYARGLVVGKFSPLHRGHELLLQSALERSERLCCFSYSSPEFPRCTAEARRRWFAELFPSIEHWALDAATLTELRARFPELPQLPHNDAPELEQRLFVARLCLQLLGGPVDAVFTSEHYGVGFAAELTRQFQATGATHTVEHVLVDLERQRIPISATALRGNAELWSRFLSPVVRASLVQRVCVLGGESTGKTTLTRKLAEKYQTAHSEEYGRELWVERTGELTYDDYSTIGRTQVHWEERAARAAHRVTFGDTSPLTTWLYCLDQFGHAPADLCALLERRYDLTLLCAPDVPFIQDGTRRDPAFRLRQHALYLQELARLALPFVTITGSYDERFAQACHAVEQLL